MPIDDAEAQKLTWIVRTAMRARDRQWRESLGLELHKRLAEKIWALQERQDRIWEQEGKSSEFRRLGQSIDALQEKLASVTRRRKAPKPPPAQSQGPWK